MSAIPRGWPLFFAKRGLKSLNLTIRAGEAFPYQDINVIRGYGPAYGVPDAIGKAASELDYVEIVDVHDRQMQRHVIQQGLNATTVKKLVGEAHGA